MKIASLRILLALALTIFGLSACVSPDQKGSDPVVSADSALEEKPATGSVPLKVINDCIDALQQQIPDRDIMLISAKRGETSYIVDLAVRGVEKPWRCYHDGKHCTGTEYQGEG